MVAPSPLITLTLAATGITHRPHERTSESVSAGHPDKMADAISDGVLDAHLSDDPNARVACETLVTTNLIVIAGEITSDADVDHEQTARDVAVRIGYDSDDLGFNGNTCEVIVRIDQQSADISQGVTAGEGLYAEQGAGDQGLMKGFACDETDECLPMTVVLSHRLLERLHELRTQCVVDWLRPDAKSQVTIRYEGGMPVAVTRVLVSTQHSPDIEHEDLTAWIIEKVIKAVIPAHLLTEDTVYQVNPTGRFVTGGPKGDCGLTGRKIIVDTYGGHGGHGGGAFSGKDPSKVDRAAAYIARFLAKLLVQAKVARRVDTEVSYAIGVAEPSNLFIDTHGTANGIDDGKIEQAIRELVDLRPAAIIKRLDLLSPGYSVTTFGGHFGREGERFTWEYIPAELIAALRTKLDLPALEEVDESATEVVTPVPVS